MPKIHLQATYFLNMGGSLMLRIFLRSKWLLELPDLEIFLSTLDFFQREKIIFCQNAYFCLKMIFRPCYFYFFSILSKWGGWVLKSMENSILFYFLFLKASLTNLRASFLNFGAEYVSLNINNSIEFSAFKVSRNTSWQLILS